MQKTIWYIFFVILYLLFQRCSPEDVEIKRHQIFDVDTVYNITERGILYDLQLKTAFFEIESNNLITALCSKEEIHILQFIRETDHSRTLKLISKNLTYPGTEVPNMVLANNKYYLLVKTEEKSDILIVNTDFQLESVLSSNTIINHLDTIYNKIGSFIAEDIEYDSLKNQLLVSGTIRSFGEDLSFAMGFDMNLNPLWFNAYLFATSGLQINSLKNNRYLILGEREGRTHIISDNNRKEYSYRNGLKEFKNYNYFQQSLVDSNSIFISAGTSENIKIGKYFFNEETNKTEKANIWPSIFGSSRPSSVISGHNDELVFTYINSSENKLVIKELNGKWENTFPLNSPDDIPLGIIKANHIGYYILILQKKNDGYYPRIIKTDDVGQTCKSLYGKNCDYL